MESVPKKTKPTKMDTPYLLRGRHKYNEDYYFTLGKDKCLVLTKDIYDAITFVDVGDFICIRNG